MNWFKLYVGIVITFVFIAMATACSGDPENFHRYNPPATHTISRKGALHNEGLKDATKNCVSCHGDDLKGKSGKGPSCFTCHDKKWN